MRRLSGTLGVAHHAPTSLPGRVRRELRAEARRLAWAAVMTWPKALAALERFEARRQRGA